MSNSTDFSAGRIESIYVHQGAQAAEEALRNDYLAANTPEKQELLKAEMTKLKEDESSTHLLAHVSLEVIKPRTVYDKMSYGRLKDMQDYGGDRPADAFRKDMAQIAETQYSTLTSLTSIRHDANLLLPWNWGRGIMTSDIERMTSELEQNRRKVSVAVAANEMFVTDDGALFHRIAGDRGTIDRDTMIKALENDNKEAASGKPRHFSDSERQTVQVMIDNWDDPAVNQLKDGTWKTSDYVKVGVSAAPVVGSVPGAYHGWRNGYEWGGWIGAVGGAIGGAVLGALPGGGLIIEGVHRDNAAGDLTLDKVRQTATEDSTLATNVLAYDSNASKNAGAQTKNGSNENSLERTGADVSLPEGKEESGGAANNAPTESPEVKQESPEVKQESPEVKQWSAQLKLPGESRTKLDSVEVERGEGCWDVAARLLGYSMIQADQSLSQRRHDLNASTTPQQKAEIFRLMTDLMHQGTNDRTFLNPGMSVKRPANAWSQGQSR